jgi:hypothetical protein
MKSEFVTSAFVTHSFKQISITFPDGSFQLTGTQFWDIIQLGALPVVLALVAYIPAAFFNAAITGHIKEVMREQQAGDFESLVAQMQEAGFSKIFANHPSDSALSDKCRAAMKKAIEGSEKFRLMTIAGFEYIGKGADSLAFRLLEVDCKKRIEVVLVDPDKARSVIKQRVQALKQRDNTISEKTIADQIQRTLERLETLKRDCTGEKEVKVWFTEHFPPFRMLILDSDVFFSAYQNDAHGHEVAVFRITKEDGTGRPLYDAFDRVFTNALQTSSSKL